MKKNTKSLAAKAILLAGSLGNLFLPALHAQLKEAAFKRYTAEDGLEGSHISALLQDRQGFLWVGTGSGLFRFDGYSFKAFKSAPTDTASLSDNFINALYEEARPGGMLWVGTTNGLNAFDPRTEKFTHFRNEQKEADPALQNFVQALWEDGSGALWVGTHRGAYRFDPAAQKFMPFGLHLRAHALPENLDASTIIAERDGTMWLGTFGQGLFRLEPQSGAVTQYLHEPGDAQSLGSNHILALAQDRSGTIWIGTHKGGFARVRPGEKKPASVSVKNSGGEDFSTIGAIVEDTEGVLWLGTSGAGLIAHEPASGDYRVFKSVPNNPHTLSNDWILAQYVDRAGNLWIGTNRGLNKLQTPRKKIGHLKNIPGDPRSLIHNNVNAITEDREGKLWIGTEQGVSVFDAQSQWLANYANDPDDANSLSQNFVQALREDKNGEMWIGTFGKGLSRLDRARRSFTHFRREASEAGSLSQNFVSTIYEDRRGDLWIGTLGGLNKLDRSRKRFVRYLTNPENPRSISHNGVTCTFEDSANRFWIGTYGGGLNRMHRDHAEFKRYQSDRANPASLSDDIVYTIFEDAQGILWIGTNGGLNRFDPAAEKFEHYSEQDGLPNNVVFGILGEAGAPNKLWISTHNGLCTFNDLLPAGQKFVKFEARKDGLQANEFNQCAFYQSPSGELFFGGPNGVNRFYPQDLKTKSAAPNVVLTAFNKLNKAVTLDTAITALTALKLSHGDVFFSFEFAALDFTLPERNEYAYKLEGFNEDWVFSGRQRHATFTNLAPGAYVFRAKGANSDGVWNEEGVALRILIAPPFWHTWWFRLFASGSLALLVWGWYRLRVNKLIALERLRVRIASDLHDDIGATLTKISLHAELIQEGACSPEVLTSLRKIGAMSRELVTTMSDVVWSIDARNDTVGNLLDRMREFAASVLSAKSVTFTFRANGLEVQKKLPVDLRQNLYLIFKEAINNIAKHAQASRAEIRLENAGGLFKMTVHDDGEASGEDARLTGQGLRNMKMRAQRIGGDLEVRRNGGFVVSLTAPALH
jgi:ligand-binding sensor domain-containing protein/signal transduction histidine kinase